MRAGLINDARADPRRRRRGHRRRRHEGLGPPRRREAAEPTQPFEGVRLLPGFDPWINELPRRTMAVLDPAHHDLIYRVAGWVTPVVVVDGRVDGTWELTTGKRGGIAVTRLERWRSGVKAELAAEVDRLAAFLDRPLPIDRQTMG